MKSTESGRNFVRYALKIGALELLPKGRALKSGRVSPYFFNSGLFCRGKDIHQLAIAYTRVLQREEFPDVIFGPAYKGIPLVAAIATHAFSEFEMNVGYAFNRKETKDHGEGGTIVGASCKGQSVSIIDDVITTGSSILEAKQCIESAGGNVKNTVISFDRMEKGVDTELSAVQVFTLQYGINVHASANLNDLIEVLDTGRHTRPLWQEMLPLVQSYRDAYGVLST